jgi:hypothetical protein
MRFAEFNVAKLFFIFGVAMAMFFGIRLLFRVARIIQSWRRASGTRPVRKLVFDFLGWAAAVIITEIAIRYR